jgi:fatty-acyl-CoA synthase
MLDYLAPRVARWWLPDEVNFAQVPLTATGKVDKKRLRQIHAPAH